MTIPGSVEVGTVLPPLSVHFTRATLVRYAGASTDFNPIHWSDRAASDLGLVKKEHFTQTRKGIVNPRGLSFEERQALVQAEAAYGHIICRCEQISEGEILDAIRRPLGARSLDGVKRRVRAGMGRCQGGFCAPKVMELLSRELGEPMTELTKSGGASCLVVGLTKEEL